ncbi:MAG: hypothetical protein ACD_13C00223G0003 [uncultured bacterium]|uniref:DUF3800 domain-containing protein n=1 Tax=Candidatus Woesebacteria bacterium GW2011_GWA1_40_43 TaxID=1618553 RepID=A0A0G0SFE2_9BACT|nr:MAG: hypothetical protein ACD_13C00223G0003 [uncultured bacterium]KKR53474.1 MAG: hypothetical protein UT88_C0009G0006 [Candidatus Woesebacteria bacterium GW2011_GWD2_40_19]KKR57119.1 MAG: hypothetical protein UT96_C0026G0004 [Candidatus Woesebacteria bacterium GW2011_GWC2_40_30]KKR63608.1 MAG: hypothetical protein UU02_C0022G0004 [Candidatus Woesebacteria bacterium GW2011_GWA1_40_43]HAU65534.1 hypothetical protein [Candidatus Woesebacteria bacterium]
MRCYELFIDELGQSNPTSKQSDVYVLSGCAIEDDKRNELKIFADQIKFKYWGNTNIVFHSREIARNEGSFSIFSRNLSRRREFFEDLYKFLNLANIILFVVVCDNKQAIKNGWNSVKVIKETGNLIFLQFTTWLLGLASAKGKVNIESATAEKDRYYLNTFSYFLAPQNKDLNVDYKIIQNILTSISFVTKRNHDIEEQIADLMAYAAKCKYLRVTKRKTFKVGSYEDKIIRLLETKLWRLPKLAGEKKMKFYKNIESFCVIPKQ